MTYGRQPGPYITTRKHHGLPESPTIKAPTDRRSTDAIYVFTSDDPTGKRWAQLKRTMDGWKVELGLLKNLANEARERTCELREVFDATPGKSILVVDRRMAYRAAQKDSVERSYDYEQCCNAIKGAEELLRKVEKFIV